MTPLNEVLWEPDPKSIPSTEMMKYIRWLEKKGFPRFEDYPSLYRWSVDNLELFWDSIWQWNQTIGMRHSNEVLVERKMPFAEWFPDSEMNFAQNLLRYAQGKGSAWIALSEFRDGREPRRISYADLLRRTTLFSHFLQDAGVRKGDRVCGVVSNTIETVVAMLATTSLGAIWSSCSPEFGEKGIVDRFGQIEPKVLIAVKGYTYGEKEFDISQRIRAVHKEIPSIERLVWIDSNPAHKLSLRKGDFLFEEIVEGNPSGEIHFEYVPFDHGVYILFSSGTTGKPKCIVHGGGGTLLQHVKELALHTNVTERTKVFYYTTTGWMMWNWLVSSLTLGAEIVLYDGNPGYPDLQGFWNWINQEQIEIFGTSAKYLSSCRSSGLVPKSFADFRSLRSILSTGSPLLPEDFDWVYANVKKDVQLSSISGGTDIVSCFLLGNPLLEVHRGELQCRGLGMDVKAFDDQGRELVGETGELVCTSPAPSMPVCFWNDPQGDKYREAYFSVFPGVWRHGDFVKFSKTGGATIYGRSDSTLNPGGVRIGTAEIYRQVETLEEIEDSLAVGFPKDGDQKVVLFVKMRKGSLLNEKLEATIRNRIREGTTPRHVPWKILAIEDIPYTMSGKKVELAVARVLTGKSVENREAFRNPDAIDHFAKVIL